ncbi:MAG: ribosome biogenesis GTPase Der [Deltaproteobacteria bacterium]|nr:ribosome biogenesis GTPase Der [Deltaproteobacteria bacterium]
MPIARLPVVAIVGRPNAGKSTLFNRLVRTQKAIVDSAPGVTRDRNIAPAEWHGRRFLLVDTGGFEDRDASPLAESVRAQSDLAAEEADVVVALLDGREGFNPGDRELVQRLRRLRKPVVVAVNKLDTPARDDDCADFFALGIEEILPISAAHGRGIGELLERVFETLPAPEDEPEISSAAIRLALVGRPNVGKSSLLNYIVGFERSIVDSTPGTTRDSIDTPCRVGEQDYILVDTAGIRRRPRVVEHIERASAVRSLKALERAEVALVLIDSGEGMTDQDARIAGYAWERGRALMLVVNKWDLVAREERDRKRFAQTIREHYPTLANAPIVFVSAQTGFGLDRLFPAVEVLVAAHRRRVRTPELNQALIRMVEGLAAPTVRNRAVRFYYATQTGWAPPVVTIFTNFPKDVAPAYQRYLLNELRRTFAWDGTPLQVRFRPHHSRDRPRPMPVPERKKRRRRYDGRH